MEHLITKAHPDWHEILSHSFRAMDLDYLKQLQKYENWLPGLGSLLAAFNMKRAAMRYILLGESPYPRQVSANGYAFWDASVHYLWSETGLSKSVNKATSLRNLIKMLLSARGDLSEEVSQEAIARLDKSQYIQTAEELFVAFMRKGFLLLNASLVYREGQVSYHARHWRPFMQALLHQLADDNPSLKLVLLGKIARQVPQTHLLPGLLAEHPYNISFITNPDVLVFFKPFDLLGKHDK